MSIEKRARINVLQYSKVEDESARNFQLDQNPENLLSRRNNANELTPAHEHSKKYDN